jgi:hypothetical protein
MRFRFLSAVALALCAVAGTARADLAWDGVIHVPGRAGPNPGQYLVCPPGTYVTDKPKNSCLTNNLLPDPAGPMKLMTLQEALDHHMKAPEGMKAVAQGPMEVFYKGCVTTSLASPTSWSRNKQASRAFRATGAMRCDVCFAGRSILGMPRRGNLARGGVTQAKGRTNVDDSAEGG